MNPENLERIEKLFHEALDLPPGERSAFLDENCHGDTELRNEIDSLLALEPTTGHFLDEAPGALAAEMFAVRDSTVRLVGTKILHYKIEKLLGVGGMGEVYLAKDTRLHRNVALKFLPDVFSEAQDRLERLVFEARSASALNHPNILTIYEIGESAGKRFITAEFVDGKTVKEMIAAGPLDMETALNIAVQVASALESAHAAGIVHRDIKPDNIMLRQDGLVKLLDFGIAKFMESDAPPGIADRQTEPAMPGAIRIGTIVGTPDYMSPEQANGGDVDPRSDIFSFGAVMYEMFSGTRPFGGDNARDILRSILDDEPAPLSELAPDVPPAIAATVGKCLSKSLDDRCPDIRTVLGELRIARRRLEFESIGERIPTSEIDPDSIRTAAAIGPGSKLKPLTMIAGTVALMLLLALGGIVGYRYMARPAQIASIAVMPIVNASGNAGAEYLSDGMTENLIRDLSTISDLSVKARATVFTYKDRQTPPATIGSELNVESVLLGRMTQNGDDLVVDLELIDTATQDVLWSANYARINTELALLQRDIARDVSVRIRPRLTSEDRTKVAQSVSADSEAQRLYLLGRFHWNKRSIKDFERAALYFEQAIARDPNFALALTGTADTYALMPLYGSYRPNEYLPKAKKAALTALELDENLAEAHASLGYIKYSYDYDWDGAERELEAALRLRPGYSTARQWHAEFLAFRGRTDEALTEISVALELDPFSLVINRMKGNILGFAKRYDEAIAQLNRTVELYPDSPVVRFNLGEAYAAKGMHDEAIEQYLKGFELDGRKGYEIRRYENAFKLKGMRGFWMEYLASLITVQKAVTESDKLEYFDYESLAYAYAATKNKEKAIEFLNRAYDVRDPSLITIDTSDVYDFLKDDPRYLDLLRKIGLAK